MSAGLIRNWNKIVIEHGPKSGAFLQSWEWGEFQKSIGRKIFRFTIKNNKLHEVIARSDDHRTVAISLDSSEIAALTSFARNDNMDRVMQVIKMPLPLRKSYLYVPRGPITISDFKFQISDFIKPLEKLTKKESAIFVKVELPIEEKKLVSELVPQTGSRSAVIEDLNPSTSFRLLAEFRSGNKHNLLTAGESIQPCNTLILDLSKSEEELLGAMHEKTRYNIRLAERKGVQVRWATPETLEKDLDSFWRLAQETAKRDGFSYHPRNYYAKMLNMNDELRIMNYGLTVKLAMAEKDGETSAANIIVFFGKTVTYLHGASNYAHRELMAPHLLQWRTIQEAKRLGYKYYDFWGTAPMNNELRIMNYGSTSKRIATHPWSGITRFKIGFGGEVVNYAPTVDLIVNKFWYRLYCLGKSLELQNG